MDAAGSLSLVGAGIESLRALSALDGVLKLNLHGNAVRTLEDGDHLAAVESLNLSANAVSDLQGLSALAGLRHLDLSANRLRSLENAAFEHLTQLTRLSLAHNKLTSIDGVERLGALQELDVRCNLLADLHVLGVVGQMRSLRKLWVLGGSRPNPVAGLPGFARGVWAALPALTHLDDRPNPLREDHPRRQEAVGAAPVQQPRGEVVAPQAVRSMSPEPEARTSDRPAPSAAPARPAVPASDREPAAPQRDAGDAGKVAVEPSATDLRASGAPAASVRDAASQTSVLPAQVKVSHEATAQTVLRGHALKDVEGERDELILQVRALEEELARRTEALGALGSDADAAVHDAFEEARKRVVQAEKHAAKKIDEERAKTSAAEQKMQEAVQATAEAKIRLAGVEARLSAAGELKQTLEQQVQILQRRLEDVDGAHRTDVARVQQDLREALDGLQGSQRRAEQAEGRVQEMEVRIAQLCAERDTANASCRSTQESILKANAAAEQARETYDKERRRLEELLQAAQATSQKEAERASLLDSKLKDLQDQYSQLCRSLQTIQTEHQQHCTTTQRAHDKELQDAVRRATEAEQANASLQQRLRSTEGELQQALVERQRDIETLREGLKASSAAREELVDALKKASGKQNKSDELVRELTRVVDQQRTHVSALKRDLQKAQEDLKRCSPERVEKLQAEVDRWRDAGQALDGIQADVLKLQDAKTEAEKQLEAAKQSWIERERALLRQLADEKEARLRTTQEIETLRVDRQKHEEHLKVKEAMLDSANGTISQLKASLARERDERSKEARELDARESEWRVQQDEDQDRIQALQAEVEAQESMMEQLEAQRESADEASRKATEELERVKAELRDRDGMVLYIEQEVERVKRLFAEKESRIQAARDEAEKQALESDKAFREVDTKCKDAVRQVEVLQERLRHAEREREKFEETAARADREAEKQKRRVEEVERELREALHEAAKSKTQADRKLRTLGTILSELQQGLLVPQEGPRSAEPSFSHQ